jgi:uncharacterized protein (DUF2062 family)
VPEFINSSFRKNRSLLLKHLAGRSTRKSISFTVGFYLSLFPVVGTTTVLCLLVSSIFKLNHYIVQALNVLMSPVQLLMVYPFVKAGRLLFFKDKNVLPDLSLQNWLAADNWDNFFYLLESATAGIIAWGIFSISTGFVLHQLILKLKLDEITK